ncbi:TerC family protein [Chloroflexota bacterium]
MAQTTWLWILFGVIFVVALSLDLFVFQRKSHVIPVKEALKLVAFWVSLAFGFAVVVYFVKGPTKAAEFITAYLIEYSLSVDNLFVFLALFTYFAVPREAQRRVLLWGILGAVFFRGIFIFAGIVLISKFHFLIYVLGVVLIYTAVKLIMQKEKEVEPEKNLLVKLARRFIRIKTDYNGSKFFSRGADGVLYATPLLVVLLSIETMDIMFAVDSVPAVFGITLDPLIVYTSNIFAILGLRALFFAIAGLFYLFRYLVYGLCAVLAFVGVKMLIIDLYQIPTLVSLGVVFSFIAVSILASILVPKKNSEETSVPANSSENEGPKK